jgi:hypothetical protein
MIHQPCNVTTLGLVRVVATLLLVFIRRQHRLKHKNGQNEVEEEGTTPPGGGDDDDDDGDDRVGNNGNGSGSIMPNQKRTTVP